MGQVRIIAGKFRSRVIKFRDNILGLRPSLDHVRETLFNWLGQDLTNKKILDLFAGSGALGFEAISRNANSVIMVENNKLVIEDLNKNKKNLNCDNLKVIFGDALQYLMKCTCDFDVLFLDPPYNSDLLVKCLNIIFQRRDDMKNILIYLETSTNLSELDLDNFEVIKEKTLSKVNYMIIKLK